MCRMGYGATLLFVFGWLFESVADAQKWSWKQVAALCTLHPAPYTKHPTPYALHPTLHTLHPTPYTLHPTPYTLHPTPYRRPEVDLEAGCEGAREGGRERERRREGKGEREGEKEREREGGGERESPEVGLEAGCQPPALGGRPYRHFIRLNLCHKPPDPGEPHNKPRTRQRWFHGVAMRCP